MVVSESSQEKKGFKSMHLIRFGFPCYCAFLSLLVLPFAAGGRLAAADGWPWRLPGSSLSDPEEEQPEWLQWIASSKSNSAKPKSWLTGWTKPSWTKSSWTAPSVPLWSATKAPKSYAPRKTTYQKFQDSSKQAWRKTVDFLDPYPPPKPASSSSSKKSSWFSGWSKPKEEKIGSVSDFLKQESPK